MKKKIMKGGYFLDALDDEKHTIMEKPIKKHKEKSNIEKSYLRNVSKNIDKRQKVVDIKIWPK